MVAMTWAFCASVSFEVALMVSRLIVAFSRFDVKMSSSTLPKTHSSVSAGAQHASGADGPFGARHLPAVSRLASPHSFTLAASFPPPSPEPQAKPRRQNVAKSEPDKMLARRMARISWDQG